MVQSTGTYGTYWYHTITDNIKVIFSFRFCFLPENSTHLMQPLDVSVFAPMKRWWRKILTAWKADLDRQNKNHASLHKRDFPGLLKQLLDNYDYKKAIISGFESTGLFPLNPERVLAKLPKKNRDVETPIQQVLLEKLSSMR